MGKVEYSGSWVFVGSPGAEPSDSGAPREPSAGLAMTPDWYRWVAENVLLRNSEASIVEAMVKAGFDPRTATREVQAAAQHPYVLAAAKLGAGASGTAAGDDGARARKLGWFLESQRKAARMGSKYGIVPRVKRPTREAFLDDFYAENRPVVIEGAMDDWPALAKWTGEYLKGRCGSETVEVQANRDSDSQYEVNQAKLRRDMPFAEFVDLVESGIETNDFYITANNSGRNKAALGVLWDDIVLPDYLRGDDPANNGFFWYGPAGTVTPLHHDLTNNFMAQVRGRKRVKLVAPNASADVYNDHHCYSPIDVERPDLHRYPRFGRVDVVDVVIGPGDLFFLPVGWWHHVRALDVSITMTFTNFVYDNDFHSFYTTYGEI